MIKLTKTISDFLVLSQNTDVSMYESSFLNKTLQKRITETKCKAMKDYYSLLKQSSAEGKILIDALQNNYSEFFRNTLTYAVIKSIVLPSILIKKNKKEIRIWSAACAQGQEAYSTAMLLEEFRNGDKDRFKYRIFATDKCESQIKKAITGIYRASDLNNVNLKQADKWFDKQNDTYTIKPELMENIDFSVFDLLDNTSSSPATSIFGDFDIVICSNLLFYFNPESRKLIIDKVTNSISNDGYLVTGEAERAILLNHSFTEIFPQSGIFQRKRRQT
ncbi:MAG: CheR family methyltransferase [Candidatus Riflemargulisbacteria bacterium]